MLGSSIRIACCRDVSARTTTDFHVSPSITSRYGKHQPPPASGRGPIGEGAYSPRKITFGQIRPRLSTRVWVKPSA